MDDSLEARSQLIAEKCVSLGQGLRRIVAGNAIRWIIVTHTHPDHSPLASRLARLTGDHVTKLAREHRASERDGLWRPTPP